MTPPAIRAIIVDDEAPARRILRRFLDDDHDIKVVAECQNGAEAVAAIAEHRPALVLLDIQMPELDGFDVVRMIGVSNMPAVIFVTAYDAYAIRAFEVHALDYLLKPFTRERFDGAIARAKAIARKTSAEQRPRLRSLLKEWQYHQPEEKPAPVASRSAHLKRLLVHDRQELISIDLKDIAWLEAADHYVLVHSKAGKHLLYERLSGLEESLPQSFVRIHRSAIVNVAHVARIVPSRFGACDVVLASGEHLRLSRSRRDALQALLSHR